MTWNDLSLLHILFIGLNLIMWVSLYAASTSDPGFLPRNIPEYHQVLQMVGTILLDIQG